MRNALSTLLFASAFLFVACGSGGSDASSSLRIRCVGGQSFCIISCDLGCSQTGCSVTEVAENQRLRFKFSDAVDPTSVNGASISIRTATGVAPNGDFEVVGSEVTFVPRVSTSNGASTFGFLRNESYIITLAGGTSIAQSVTNLSGDGLSEEFSCTVVASLGILDEDQASPTVELLSPTVLVNAPVNPTIVLRFSELIDTTPLLVSLGAASPIRVVLRGTLPSGLCDTDADGTALEGVPQLSTELVGSREVTVVTFQSAVQLPGNSCITVRVTSDLRDLSGRSAIPAKFVFLTQEGVSVPIEVTETFSSNTKQEVEISGGVWGGPQGSGARPGLIGGDGRHGSFDRNLGVSVGNGIYIWNIDNILIPETSSLTGLQYVVTDGRFFFTDMIVPEGQTIQFVGSVAPVIRVRGQVEINGRLLVNGVDGSGSVETAGLATGLVVSNFNARVAPGQLGQVGTNGGCGAGKGGRGGREGLNAGPIITNGTNITNGQPGSIVGLRAGHAYAGNTGGSGGLGGTLTPATGFWAVPPPTVGIAFCGYFCSGGSGGGFTGAGQQPNVPVFMGTTGTIVSEPRAQAGSMFDLMPYPPASPPANYTSLDHFLVSGSGGGGGGSHGYGLIALGAPTEKWMAGHGGTGGGGAIAIRSGGTLIVGAAGELEARGGDGAVITGSPSGGGLLGSYGISSPGGGGSGGSVLLQSGQGISFTGDMNMRGGTGSPVGFISSTSAVNARGGDGSPGFFRLETPTGASFGGVSTPSFDPQQNAGVLTDRDDLSGDTSLWYGTGQVFPPTWDRYELDVDFDGDGVVDITYTDSGAPGTQKASELNGPITLPLVISFQGASLNQAGTVPIEPPGPWRDGIGSGGGQGISLDSVTGFRFTMTYNRALFPDVVVRELRVFAQT